MAEGITFVPPSTRENPPPDPGQPGALPVLYNGDGRISPRQEAS